MAGELGTECKGIELLWASSMVVREADLVMADPKDGLRLPGADGRVPVRRGGGCCRMRRRPERPRPWSWSVMTELLRKGEEVSNQVWQDVRYKPAVGGLESDCVTVHRQTGEGETRERLPGSKQAGYDCPRKP